MAKVKILNKKFMLVNSECYNIVIVEAKDKSEALKEAKRIMVELDKYEDFTIKDVIELCGKRNDNKTYIYRGTDDVKDVWVEELEK